MANDSDLITETVDLDSVPVSITLGKWAPLVRELVALPPGRCKRINRRLTTAETQSFRSAARYQGRRIHIRNRIIDGVESTWVWAGGTCADYSKYRQRPIPETTTEEQPPKIGD